MNGNGAHPEPALVASLAASVVDAAHRRNLPMTAPAAPKTLLLVDLSCVFFRAWHAAAGKPSEAADVPPWRVALHLIGHISTPYDYHAIAVDAGTSFRREISPTYKANRPDKDPVALEQLRTLIRTLEDDGRAVLRVDGYEADDVIASVVYWSDTRSACAEAPDFAIDIASTDKDLLALVGPACHVFDPYDQARRYHSTEDVALKFGVGSDKLPELLALMGDKADNVPGIAGIGRVIAAQLLRDYGSIAGAMAAAADPTSRLTPSIRSKLLAGDADAALSLRLVTLRTDVPVDFAKIMNPPAPKPAQVTGGGFDDEDSGGAASALPPQGAEREPSTTAATVAAHAPAPPHGDGGSSASTVGPPRETQTVALVRHEGDWKTALEPRDPRGAFVLAERLFNSRLFSAYGNPDAIFAVVLAGRSMGLDAMTSLRGFHIIKGKPVMSAALVVGVVLRSGKARYFSLKESTRERATYETWRAGDPEPVKMSFDVEDAADMGKLVMRDGYWVAVEREGNWAKSPRTMLRHRCAAELARAVYPDVVSNCYVPGELDEGDIVVDADFDDEPRRVAS